MERERPVALIYDQEFTDLLSDLERVAALRRLGRRVDKVDETSAPAADLNSRQGEDLEPPAEHGRYIILTSGTTGTPKGAQRSQPEGLNAIAALLSKIPRRTHETVMIAAPLFHSWGFLHFMLSLPTAATMVLRPRFDPEDTLQGDGRASGPGPGGGPGDDATHHQPPRRDQTPLRPLVPRGHGRQRLGPAWRARHRWMDEFGDNIYNLYGSTEVAWATSRRRRTCAPRRGQPDGRRGAPWSGSSTRRATTSSRETGRLFIGNQLPSRATRAAGTRSPRRPALSGDVGHFDEDGRLFVDGRDDEMIVSGGENVFPREVEDLLTDYEASRRPRRSASMTRTSVNGSRLRGHRRAAPRSARTT